jgi:hypothetical protein
MTAHKILIASAIVFFFVYAGWELLNFRAGGAWALVRSGVSLGVAVGFLLYYRSLPRE